MDECEGSIDDLSDFGKELMNLYGRVHNQVLVAGFGDVLGLNHLTLHQYLQMQGYKFGSHYYRCVFEALNDISNFEWEQIRARKKTNKSTAGGVGSGDSDPKGRRK